MASPVSPVRAVQRALLLLRALNESEMWGLAQLQERTQLPKSTLHRLLATLQAEGYVYSGEETYGQYRLTPLAANLSWGVTQKSRLAEIARPIVIAATKTLKWPLAVAIADGPRLQANVCTMPYSPYSMRPTCMGQHYDLFSSALGQCYLAFCASKERRILLELDAKELGTRRWTRQSLLHLIRTVRRRGYAFRQGALPSDSSAFSVPVFDKDKQIVCSLGCSTFSRLSVESWIERNLPFVQSVALDIGQRL